MPNLQISEYPYHVLTTLTRANEMFQGLNFAGHHSISALTKQFFSAYPYYKERLGDKISAHLSCLGVDKT